MLNKLLIACSILISSSLAQASASITGTWQCQFKSQHITADQVLSIRPNGSYSLVATVFGADMTDLGSWKLNGNTLILHRTVHIGRKGKQKSDFTQHRQIRKLTARELVLTQGQGISICIRK